MSDRQSIPRGLANRFLSKQHCYDRAPSIPDDLIESGHKIFGAIRVADGDVSVIYLDDNGITYFHSGAWQHASYDVIDLDIHQVQYRANGWLVMKTPGATLNVMRANPALFDVHRFFEKCRRASTSAH